MEIIVRTRSGPVKKIYLDCTLFVRYTPAMKKTGRPRKKASESKTDWIEVRCEEAEKQAFRQAAEAQGLALSAWIRQALVERRGKSWGTWGYLWLSWRD